MNVVIGIDGGGTKTKVCLMEESGIVLGYGEAGPSSIDTVRLDQMADSFFDALQKLDNPLWKQATKVFIGMGGVITNVHQEMVKQIIRDRKWFLHHPLIQVRNDVENALASGGLFQEGMALICGTGAVAYGKTLSGVSHRAGGWGYKEGDAGSAYDVGYQALKTLTRAMDHRFPQTEFTQDLAKEVRVNSPSDIIQVMDQLWDQRTKIASLAKFVTHYANQGDHLAKAICDQATTELAQSISAVYHTLNQQPKQLVIIGSLGNAPGYFHDQLVHKIHQIDTLIQIVPIIYDPAHGAAILASELK